MNTRIYIRPSMMVALIFMICVVMGCGSSDDHGPSLQDIPLYPNATEGESMEQSSPGGFMGGKLVQYSTTDAFDEVLEFYTDALTQQNPEFMSHTSELGRQTAISIPQKNGIISIAIQEFTEEGTVNITFMAMGT